MTDTPTRADLIERLRSVDVSWSEVGEWCAEAAATLTADAERIAALEAALERIADRPGESIEYIPGHGDEVCSEARHMELIARAALEGTSRG